MHLFLFQPLDELHSVTATSRSNQTMVGTRDSHRSTCQTLSCNRRQAERSSQNSRGRTQRKSLSTGSTQIIVAHIRGNFGGPNRSVPNTGVRDEDVGTRTLGRGRPVISSSAMFRGLCNEWLRSSFLVYILFM